MTALIALSWSWFVMFIVISMMTLKAGEKLVGLFPVVREGMARF
jgi:hypothetical protein